MKQIIDILLEHGLLGLKLIHGLLLTVQDLPDLGFVQFLLLVVSLHTFEPTHLVERGLSLLGGESENLLFIVLPLVFPELFGK
jgi:hypothetical protein